MKLLVQCGAVVTIALTMAATTHLSLVSSQAIGISAEAAAYRMYRQDAKEHIDMMLDSVRIQDPSEQARLQRDRHGYLKLFGAPPGAPARFDSGVVGASVEERTFRFIQQFGAAFGIYSPETGFTVTRVNQERDRTYVRLQQWYDDVPVFAGAMNVQLDDAGGVLAAVSGLMTNTYDLDTRSAARRPTLTSEDAEIVARFEIADLTVEEFVRREIETPLDAADLVVSTPPVLTVFDPALVGQPGQPALAWEVKVRDIDYIRLHKEGFSGCANRRALVSDDLDREEYGATDNRWELDGRKHGRYSQVRDADLFRPELCQC